MMMIKQNSSCTFILAQQGKGNKSEAEPHRKATRKKGWDKKKSHLLCGASAGCSATLGLVLRFQRHHSPEAITAHLNFTKIMWTSLNYYYRLASSHKSEAKYLEALEDLLRPRDIVHSSVPSHTCNSSMPFFFIFLQ